VQKLCHEHVSPELLPLLRRRHGLRRLGGREERLGPFEETHRNLRISPVELDEVAAERGLTLEVFKIPSARRPKSWRPSPPTRTRSQPATSGAKIGTGAPGHAARLKFARLSMEAFCWCDSFHAQAKRGHAGKVAQSPTIRNKNPGAVYCESALPGFLCSVKPLTCAGTHLSRSTRG
jgi:hypothetical protein